MSTGRRPTRAWPRHRRWWRRRTSADRPLPTRRAPTTMCAPQHPYTDCAPLTPNGSFADVSLAFCWPLKLVAINLRNACLVRDYMFWGLCRAWQGSTTEEQLLQWASSSSSTTTRPLRRDRSRSSSTSTHRQPLSSSRQTTPQLLHRAPLSLRPPQWQLTDQTSPAD